MGFHQSGFLAWDLITRNSGSCDTGSWDSVVKDLVTWVCWDSGSWDLVSSDSASWMQVTLDLVAEDSCIWDAVSWDTGTRDSAF